MFDPGEGFFSSGGNRRWSVRIELDSFSKITVRAQMNILAVVLFLVLSLFGLALIPIGLPGTFVVVAASGLAGLLTGWNSVGLVLFLFFLGLAILGEVTDYLFSVISGKKFGASRASLGGSLVGAIVGSILGLPVPVVGNLEGAFLGAFAGAFLVEMIRGNEVTRAMKSGVGVLLGKVFGSIFKVSIAMGIIVKVTISLI